MSAQDHLGGQFYMHTPAELGYLASRDYGGKLRDLEFAPGGESDVRVRKIMETAATEGIREPVVVDARNSSYMRDGHHRYVAAKRLGIKLPVQYID